MIKPKNYQFTQTSSYTRLQSLFHQGKRFEDKQTNDTPQESQAGNKNRSSLLRFETLDFYVDFTRHGLSEEIVETLLRLAEESPLAQTMPAFFRGDKINLTENRPALHTALRAQGSSSLGLKDTSIHHSVSTTLHKMKHFCESLHKKTYLGDGNSEITDVVHIGIGGSHLGPQLVSEALKPFWQNKVRVHFWSAVDNYASQEHPLLQTLTPQNTLFILASKSFTTQEMKINAERAKQWLKQVGGIDHWDKHFVALTANVQAAKNFGISSDHLFPLWDWVGGRYSVWSAIGLPVMLNVGYDHFMNFLEGASEMDSHFLHTPWQRNLPILMALIGIWYLNFCHAHTQAVLTYHSSLQQLPFYLQQLEMESNGKSVNLDNRSVDYQTAGIVWGGSGIKGQHSYHQLLHQGTLSCPIDFIGVADEPASVKENYFLLSNLLAQSYVLNQGKQVENTHQCLEGNRPSTILLMKNITPQAVGRLLALYEHKVFVQGVIWHINSFDQWGVEEGKRIAHQWEKLFANPSNNDIKLDSTTHSAVQFIKKAQQKQ